MYAIRLHAFGPPENLRYEKVDDPEPGPGQARIAVAAAGVHLIDTTIRAGESTGLMPESALRRMLPELPAIPGREVAGVVDAVGDGVDRSWLGRRVAVHLGFASGGYAELAVCDVEALLALPDGLSDAAGVAMLGTGRTALGILRLAQLTDADVVLVTAAAGGIGSLLVQAARNAGATTVGLAGGAAKLARVRELGAHAAVDYAEPGWIPAVREALGDREPTVALDGVGGELGRGALELLGPGGRLVMFGAASGDPIPLSAGDLFANGLTVSSALGPLIRRPDRMRELSDAALAEAAAGRLEPLVGQSFPLAEVATAHTAVETRATVGKTVLVP